MNTAFFISVVFLIPVTRDLVRELKWQKLYWRVNRPYDSPGYAELLRDALLGGR